MPDFPLQVQNLTKRQVEILKLSANGMSVSEIADSLFIDKRTVDFHLGNAYKSLGVRNKKSAIEEAQLRGYFQND
jgi:LuxR family transcriptional regulator